MRGQAERQAMMLVGTIDGSIPETHPLRRVRAIVEGVLKELSPRFNEMYSKIGRPSVPPEQLLKASLLMALFSIPSERRLCEELRYNLLFKWFLDLNVGEEPFDPTSFSQNRTRLMNTDLARAFLAEVVLEAQRRKLISDEHFTVDGTLIEAWASNKSVRPRDEQDPPDGAASGGRNPEVDFRGQRRTNETHVSRTDPEARLARKSNAHPAKPSYTGHILMENRNGLVVDAMLNQATGTAERDAATTMLRRGKLRRRRATVAGDKAYDTRQFVADCREQGVTPHVAQNTSGRRSAIDGRTTRHAGYRLSQRVRKRVEEIFGWAKTVALTRKLRYIGQATNEFWFLMVAVGYNLRRMVNIEARALA